MALTQEQIDHYNEHGYVSPIDVFTEDETAAIRTDFERAEREHQNELNAEHRNNPHVAFPLLAEICFNQRIVEAVQSLLGSDLVLWGSVLFIKEPQSAGFVSWHQDARYMALEPHDFTTPWLALSPSNLESGCMSMIPGSHLAPLVDHEDTFADDNILTRGQAVSDVDDSRAVHLELRPGQMSIHHPRIIHGSQPNRSSERRIGFAMQSYMHPACQQNVGKVLAMPIAGNDDYEHLELVPRPDGEATAEGVAARKRVNDNYADILYQGAEKRRLL